MTPRARRTACRILCLVFFFSLAGAVAADPNPEVIWRLTPRHEGGAARLPAPPADLPTQLILDDDSVEADFGVAGVGATAKQFLWFNQFSLAEATLLEEIWVLYTAGPNMAVNNVVQLAVYADADADPANGATLLATYDATVDVLDGVTFSVFELPAPLLLAPGDVLIGVVSRFVTSDSTSTTSPAAVDTSASQGRSWVAVWTGDPPPSPDLPPDSVLDLVDFVAPAAAGNFMIRGFGIPVPVVPVTDVPALGAGGLAVLAGLLGLAGGVIARRRSRRRPL